MLAALLLPGLPEPNVWTPARRSSRRALRTCRRTTSHGRRRRFHGRAPTSGRGVVEHVRRGPLRYVVHILLPDTSLYLYIFVLLLYACVHTYYIPLILPCEICRDDRRRRPFAVRSFVCLFVVSSLVFASFSIFHSTPASYFYMRDAETNSLVTY